MLAVLLENLSSCWQRHLAQVPGLYCQAAELGDMVMFHMLPNLVQYVGGQGGPGALQAREAVAGHV